MFHFEVASHLNMSSFSILCLVVKNLFVYLFIYYLACVDNFMWAFKGILDLKF